MQTSMRHAASWNAVPPKALNDNATDEQMAHIGDVHRTDVTDSNMDDDTHHMGDVKDIVDEAHMVHISNTRNDIRDSDIKHHESHKSSAL